MTPRVQREVDFEAEAQLGQEFQFPNAISPDALAPRTVFLTGATGFLGAYLLDELLRKTQADVYCLVRADSETQAAERLETHLRSYDLWRQADAPRIHPLVGDVTQTRFNLPEYSYRRLAATIDVIYHSAGWLNMAFPYARLKPVNVDGVKEILRLAGLERTKPVHFLSSMVVFFSDAHTNDELLKESDTPIFDPGLKGGYSKSKWVADRLVAAAQQRGLPACIYRPVRIMGHSRTGAINDLNDVLPMLLKGCILLGKYPALDIRVTMVPVDVISRAMVHLAGDASSWGKAFHFFHPSPIPWIDLMEILRDRGFALEETSYDQWWKELKSRMQDPAEPQEQRSVFSSVMMAMTAPHFLFFKRPPLDSTQVRAGLKGSGIEYPPIDDKLVGTYVDYWRSIRFIP